MREGDTVGGRTIDGIATIVDLSDPERAGEGQTVSGRALFRSRRN
jgi:hypothetical protein